MKKNTYGILSTRKSVRNTPASRPIPEKKERMVLNNAGGYVFSIGSWKQLDRFLILGTEGGTYYVKEKALTIENAKVIQACLNEDFNRTVDRIAEISYEGRAPKNDPALFALAIAMTVAKGDAKKLSHLFANIPSVARIGTHLFHLASYVDGMRGWGRSVRRGFASWYSGKTNDQLAYQLGKYQTRDGWGHSDILRLCHGVLADKELNPVRHNLFDWTLSKEFDKNSLIGVPLGIELLKETKDINEMVRIVSTMNLPHEAIPTEVKTDPRIWEAMLPNMGLEAMIRNLGNMTKYGVFKNAKNRDIVVKALGDKEKILKSRLHPIKILSALSTYSMGRGMLGDNSWVVDRYIVEALDAAFYLSFGNVTPTGKKLYIALDISGSMGIGTVGGVLGLTPMKAEAALCMVTLKTEEKEPIIKGFTADMSGGYSFYSKENKRGSLYGGVVGDIPGISTLHISKDMTLEKVESYMSRFPMGGTDASLPFKDALNNKYDVDAFVLFTDNETWHGGHPDQLLNNYRVKMNKPDCKLVVVSMTATDSSIGDPNDKNVLDVVGFDTATPELLSRFISGEF